MRDPEPEPRADSGSRIPDPAQRIEHYGSRTTEDEFLIRPLEWPPPIDDLWSIGAVLVRVVQILDDRALHLFLQMRTLGAKFVDAVDDIDHQMEPGRLVQHRQF